MKKVISVLIVLLLPLLAACGQKEAPSQTAGGESAQLADPGRALTEAEALDPQAEPMRQDGERFEAVILLEGMEETVHYEHIRNEALGFEMDYDYEALVRRSEADRELFLSAWDDPDDPMYYLEVKTSPQDAEAVAASICERLSGEYALRRGDAFTLERAGSCIRIDADEGKGGGYMPERLQTVYIIPAGDGCRIAAAHCAMEGAEGFGRRFGYMMETFSVLAR